MARQSSFYYLDIETTGLDPEKDEIITLQFQNITFNGDPVGELHILKSWESSEKDILERFYPRYADKWSFIPVGFNLDFEKHFLYKRFKTLLGKDLFQRLYRDGFCIDLQPMVILMQDGLAKGSSLHNWSPKVHGGTDIPDLYKAGEYDKVEEYIRMETESFLELYRLMIRLMPYYRKQFFKNVEWPVVFKGEPLEPGAIPQARTRRTPSSSP